MADDLVTFNIRFEKLQYALKMKTPSDFHGFNEKLVIYFEEYIKNI